MAALDYLRRAGLTVESVADKLRVSPVERITADHRQYLIEHRAELLAELAAVNDPPTSPVHPSGAPQHFIRTAATASPDWRQARGRYVGHLMSCRACHAPTGRHCLAGAELRMAYDSTPWSWVFATASALMVMA